ncbi:hypothetical protein TVAG_161070 [Trichomonas vaginalis G3]|uniref:Uncharacterized protein n=1 Tax=Trichomonas vaginalis (strain ATCC PRA-98 / G3) TaxID=412133 RepID=A2E4W2_TRIV3|nr:nuclear chaperone required for maturation and nuclear export of pre-60s ribosome subunits [Trichomonas vaginalis G3]EAY12301.1 hypothetical protein TVAG_161070 [Trichomonas vaginalis G3]KAI5552415.1 nuclear chaperone required for maturation and nuclear export of pre-60s ribosome subunits [Trichomonas vaginalis G3]|eukprot:XP_001324524.1 hypothetical protein [Trichomonas vaginalis G3]
MKDRIQRIAAKGIDVCFFYTHHHAYKAVNAFETYFHMYGGKDFKTMYEEFNNSGDSLKNEVTGMLHSIIDDAVASFKVGKVKETFSTSTVLRKQRSQRREIRTNLLNHFDSSESIPPKSNQSPKFVPNNEPPKNRKLNKKQKKKIKRQEKRAKLELENQKKKYAQQNENADADDEDISIN